MLDSDFVRKLKVKPNPKAPTTTPDQVNFYILNYSTSNFRQKFLDEYNMSKVRLNFAPHAYILPNSKPGENYQFNVHLALYTQWNGESSKFFKVNDPLTHGVEMCSNNDGGRIQINPQSFIDGKTI